MAEIGFVASSGSVPLYIDNSGTLHVIEHCTYSVRTKRMAFCFFYARELHVVK